MIMEEILLRTIYVNATFFTMDQENQIFEKGMMIVENQSISYIGPYSIKRLADTDLVVDLGGMGSTRPCKCPFTYCDDSFARYRR